MNKQTFEAALNHPAIDVGIKIVTPLIIGVLFFTAHLLWAINDRVTVAEERIDANARNIDRHEPALGTISRIDERTRIMAEQLVDIRKRLNGGGP